MFPALNAGLVGLSMTYAMTLMGMFQWGVRQSAEVENQVSVYNMCEVHGVDLSITLRHLCLFIFYNLSLYHTK